MRDVPADVIVVYVTAPRGEAARIARVLVEQRLATCVNVVPEIQSIYRWEGEVHHESESLLVVKTTKDGFEALARGVRSVHPYKTPEIIALPVVAGDRAYLDWVADGVRAVDGVHADDTKGVGP